MNVKNPEKIKFRERENVRTSFSLKGIGKNSKLVVLTDQRIYFAGSSKKKLKRNYGIDFINLDSVTAGSVSKQKGILFKLIFLLTLVVGAAFTLADPLKDSFSLLYDILGNIGLQTNGQMIGFALLGVSVFALLIHIKSTKKVIVLKHMGGDDLLLPMNGVNDDDINNYLEIIADGIDG